MPSLIQLVQGTEQVLPTATIRYMVVVDLIVKLESTTDYIAHSWKPPESWLEDQLMMRLVGAV